MGSDLGVREVHRGGERLPVARGQREDSDQRGAEDPRIPASPLPAPPVPDEQRRTTGTADTTGAQSGITVKGYEPVTGDKVAAALPLPLGSGVKTFQDIASTTSDGSLSGSGIGTLASDGAGFVSSCMDVAGIASDPIGWLVGQGLIFLMTVVQLLQDLVHLVTGDGPRLANAAGNFNAIGAGVAKKLGKFTRGIDGVAAQAGDFAQFPQISSMIMSVIEEFIKGILTELIMIWIPTPATAMPTFGATTGPTSSRTRTSHRNLSAIR